MTELPTAQVTIGDLYRELVGMRGDLSRSLSKLEVIESRNSDADRIHNDHEARLRAGETALATLPGLATHTADLEGRIRQLEKFRWQVVGALILISGAALYVGYLLGHK